MTRPIKVAVPCDWSNRGINEENNKKDHDLGKYLSMPEIWRIFEWVENAPGFFSFFFRQSWTKDITTKESHGEGVRPHQIQSMQKECKYKADLMEHEKCGVIKRLKSMCYLLEWNTRTAPVANSPKASRSPQDCPRCSQVHLWWYHSTQKQRKFEWTCVYVSGQSHAATVLSVENLPQKHRAWRKVKHQEETLRRGLPMWQTTKSDG